MNDLEMMILLFEDGLNTTFTEDELKKIEDNLSTIIVTPESFRNEQLADNVFEVINKILMWQIPWGIFSYFFQQSNVVNARKLHIYSLFVQLLRLNYFNYGHLIHKIILLVKNMLDRPLLWPDDKTTMFDTLTKFMVFALTRCDEPQFEIKSNGTACLREIARQEYFPADAVLVHDVITALTMTLRYSIYDNGVLVPRSAECLMLIAEKGWVENAEVTKETVTLLQLVLGYNGVNRDDWKFFSSACLEKIAEKGYWLYDAQLTKEMIVLLKEALEYSGVYVKSSSARCMGAIAASGHWPADTELTTEVIKSLKEVIGYSGEIEGYIKNHSISCLERIAETDHWPRDAKLTKEVVELLQVALEYSGEMEELVSVSAAACLLQIALHDLWPEDKIFMSLIIRNFISILNDNKNAFHFSCIIGCLESIAVNKSWPHQQTITRYCLKVFADVLIDSFMDSGMKKDLMWVMSKIFKLEFLKKYNIFDDFIELKELIENNREDQSDKIFRQLKILATSVWEDRKDFAMGSRMIV